MFETIKQAEDLVGGLSKPSKMPGYAYGLPASRCITGAKLAKVAGTVCSKCYALKGRYGFKNVQDAQERRFKTITHKLWADAMIYLMHKRKIEWFRWHDSGDIQSAEHLARIAYIAERCPDTNFWLPTRERGFVKKFLSKHSVPKNLVIRISDTNIEDGPRSPPGVDIIATTSSVVTSKADASCPAYTQGGICGDCRMCWDPKVVNISYPQH